MDEYGNNFNFSYQQELIGMLANKPEYFKTDILRKSFFDEPYATIFEVMADSYKKDGVVNFQVLMQHEKVDKAVAVESISNVARTDKIYFNSLVRNLLENWKKKVIKKEAFKVVNLDGDINLFFEKMKKLDEISFETTSHYYSDENIQRFINTNNNNLTFTEFKRLQSYSKVKEHDLVIVAGKTGTGKTGFALNLLRDLSENYPVLYINIELSESNITQRNIAMNTGIEMYDLDNVSMLPQKELNKIYQYAESLEEKNIHIVTGSQNIESIRRLIGEFEQDKHFIVIIDHIGRIHNRQGRGLYEKATYNVIALRNLSLDYNCTIFGLSQLSREASKADYPSLDLLRDSGEVEQSARKVWFVWEDKNGNYGIHIVKNDSGINGIISVEYNKKIQKFTEVYKNNNDKNKDVRF